MNRNSEGTARTSIARSLVFLILACCSCDKPEAPIEKPETPVEKPGTPVEKPEAPIEKLETPVEKPEGPVEEVPNTLIKEGYDEQEMAAAIARARGEVDAFIQEFSEGNGNGFSVKVAIKDGGETEHFWLTDISYEEGEFSGEIGNDPGIVSNVKIGQQWTVKKSEISDWMFMRDDKMHGNYTMRPLLKTMPKKLADQFRALFAEP